MDSLCGQKILPLCRFMINKRMTYMHDLKAFTIEQNANCQIIHMIFAAGINKKQYLGPILAMYNFHSMDLE